MVNKNDFIICGPKEDYDIPKISIGKYILNRLKQRNSEEIIMIDAATEDTLTCAELIEDSIKAANVFTNFGLEYGDVISIISQNNITFSYPIVAAFYLGLTANLLNPSYSKGELKHALLLSKPKLVLCDKNSSEAVTTVLQELGFDMEKVLALGLQENQSWPKSLDHLSNEGNQISLEGFEPKDFDYAEVGALILMSSGTTGLPKGVLLTHKNLWSAIGYMSHSKYGNLMPTNVCVGIIPFFHVFGLSILLSTITSGATMVVMNKFKTELFLKSIEEYRITNLYVVPTIVSFLAKTALLNKYDLSSIKYIGSGAAPISKELCEETSKRLGNVCVRQGYGLTETSSGCIVQKTDCDVFCCGSLTLQAEAKVWDAENQKLLGKLEAGELCIRGPMIMKEYVGNPSATRDCIDDDGFYHTGDIGYYDENELFYLVGREKEIIKCKGYQVPPTELENLILTHPSIEDCAVIGIPNEKCGEVPLAFVVVKPGTNISEEEIVNYVSERISPQKRLYGGVKFIEKIPKNSASKILRRSLKEMLQKMK